MHGEVRRILKGGIRRVMSLLGGLHAQLDRRPGDSSAECDGTEEARVSGYWSTQFEAMRTDSSYWLNNRIVEEWTYRLMTGTPDHWLNWLLSDYFKDRKFCRSLSICCGDGAHEIQLYKSGKVECVNGFDISEGAIQQARRRFEEAGAPRESYRLEVRDVNGLKLEGNFDLVLSTGALHHTANLEGLLGNLQQVLSSDGYFVMVEFIGPSRFQWTDRQMGVSNRILAALDPHYLRDGCRATVERPTIESMLKADPSEAIRSEEVYPLVKQHFSVVYERFYNGTILHQLHPLLQSQLANRHRKDFDSIVRLILLMEDLLVSNRVLTSDFVFLICRHRNHEEARERGSEGMACNGRDS